MYANLKVHENIYDKTVTLFGPCVVTGKQYSVVANRDEFDNYCAGELIQNAFPKMSIDDREFLISGYSPEGWLNTFGPNEED